MGVATGGGGGVSRGSKFWGTPPFFGQCDGYTTHFYVFWHADYEPDIENFEFEKLAARVI